MPEPIRVVVTGAAGQIAYSLLYSVGKGDVFGHDQPLVLVLLDIAPMMTMLEGVVMELQDCAMPLVKSVVTSADPDEAFKGAHAAMLVGAMPRKEGMERADLLKANAKIFETQGKSIDQHADKNIKIVVVGNPANTNALICSRFAPSIPKENFTCLTRLDQNRAQAQVALRVGTTPENVKNCIIWGNHSSTQYPDVNHGTVNGQPIRGVVKDDNWLNNEFLTTVQKRGAAVIAARKLSSAMSAAKAICDHMRDWWHGTKDGEWVSMGVPSDGSYGIPEGIIYSFPVNIKADKTYSIVQGLNIDDFSRAKMDATAKELVEERDTAFSFLTK